MARKRDDPIKLVLRLPRPLHHRLGRAARVHSQSLNTEMIDRLEATFRWPELGQAVRAIRDAARKGAAGVEQRSREQMLEAAEMLRRASDLLTSVADDQSEDEGEGQ